MSPTAGPPMNLLISPLVPPESLTGSTCVTRFDK
jgi:hypothetical protein